MKYELTNQKLRELRSQGLDICPYLRNMTYREHSGEPDLRGDCSLTHGDCCNGLEQSCEYVNVLWGKKC